MTEDKTLHQSNDELEASQRKSESRDGPPAMVPGYDLEYRLGRGAYGEVWLAVDGNTRRRVAIKFYNRSGGVDVSMLAREVEKLARLAADRYVVQLLEVGWNATPPYYVMDFIEGGSLEDLLGDGKLVDQEHAIEIFHDVVMGLKHLHNKGILHCDLKPGNVLLDTDHKPRLADFGQSRLDSEQAPALGTLFYMAPEQANLNAIPDVRWDIYSAGIILYCMLTGTPPHRDESTVHSIQQYDGVEQRLEAYRRQVQKADIQKKIKSLNHVDSELKEILSKCLAKQPQKRFQSAQEVLWKLKERDAKHTKRPLMILGVISPLLILIVMITFFGYIYQQITVDADRAIIEEAGAGNRWAAQYVARTASHQIDMYFDAVSQLAENPKLKANIELLRKVDFFKKAQAQLGNPRNNHLKNLDIIRSELAENKYAGNLIEILRDQAKSSKFPRAASWFITDPYGTQLASSLEGTSAKPVIGKNYSYRTYFSGLDKDIDYKDDKEFQKIDVSDPKQLSHIKSSHISAVFRSTATGQWKVAFTRPYFIEEEFGGIIAVTVETGSFVDFQNGPDLYAILVDGRQGDFYGTVLEHPYFADAVARKKAIPDEIFEKRVAADSLTRDYGVFSDPIGEQTSESPDPARTPYSGKWIAGLAKVKSKYLGSDMKHPKNTGLVVLAAKRYEKALESSHKLGTAIFQLAVIALGGFLAVFAMIGLFAFRTMKRTGGRFLRYDSLTLDPDSTQK